MRFLAALLLLSPITALGHPGNGIVALSATSVLTGDALNIGLWRFELGKAPVRLTRQRFHCHWVTRGLDGGLYGETLSPAGGRWVETVFRLDAQGGNPAAVTSEPEGALGVFAVDAYGAFVFEQRGMLLSRRKDGRALAFAEVGIGERPLDVVRAFAWGPDGSTLYLADGATVRRVGKDRVIRVAATISGTVTDSLYARKDRKPLIRGLAVDGQGRIFAAVPSIGQVVRIDRDDSRHVAARGVAGWGITGVAVYGSTIFLLEVKTKGTENEGPRVRRIRPDGKIENLGRAG